MSASTLSKAKVVGYFSIPGDDVAEHNPSAYAAAMACLPPGAGTCSQCGTGIKHHIVIIDGQGTKRFIGQMCAAKVGLDPEQVRSRLTDEQQEVWDERRKNARDAAEARYLEALKNEQAIKRRRAEVFSGVLGLLRKQGSEFHNSLADQLEQGPLSRRQADYAVKVTSDTGRRNRLNGEAWDRLFNLMTAEDLEAEIYYQGQS